MVLTRAQNQPGPDGILGNGDDIQNASNTDSPWVDQSQTYTSHASHQVFLRDYDLTNGVPVANGHLLGGIVNDDTCPNDTNTVPCYNDGKATDGNISTWAAVKQQAAQKLGLLLKDKDVTDIPMLATDPYGEFIPGPNGLPQYALKDGSTLEGDLTNPVPVPANVVHFDTPFLTDIAHNADPSPQDTDNNPGTPPVAPVPDDNNTATADFASQPAGTYDDEMLNDHFACGDGRCNENIALSTIHQIFHSEHDRLVGDIEHTLSLPENAALSTAFHNTHTDLAQNDPNRTFGYGDRLFQAARFVTEMEYQHLVFEEFARKVQPAVKPFHVYSPDINPAIHAEFAHAVYRFGHSMLDDDVARKNADGSDNSLPLLTAFLNPPEFFDNGTAAGYTPQQAAGSIVMGSSDQTGNELDEFVTETLRNNLLGLPLDLAAINMTRAREAGVPPLNEVRRQIFADTGDSALAPYTSWSDFGQHLKHPESLINFVAAYGQHPSITSATTLADKRAAAKLIVDPADPLDPAIPTDAADFMFGTGAYADDANGRTTTGLDDVDLWVGGLAEVTNLNGGLLGSTFNYVFQSQLEDLQDGDRLYYLNRTPGMNLRTQLESNSFSEMIQRNTDGTNSLKADAFATADCKFQLANLEGTPAGYVAHGATVADDPTTPCLENKLLLRKPDGTIQYRAINTIDPSGINGQSVYNGTVNNDRVAGGNDNDTFWGGQGNDRIEGQGGDDVALGGPGNDILSDLDGADVSKGGAGNDSIDSGPGDDIAMGGDGQDFMNGGLNDNESFAGPGNDFVIAGAGADAVFGDGGDDWIQGGLGQDLLQGDHGAPFFDDPAETAPGNDIFVGQTGENDYDAEGGDDIMSQNAAIDRNAGAGGFDWAIHQYDTVGANDDMAINNFLAGAPIQVVVNRDRWQETEADSGSAFNDTIRGTNDVPSAVGGAGFTGCDVLDQAGVDRIKGLAALLPQPLTGDLAPVVANSAAGVCPLSGPIWGDGDMLLGGGGSDTIEGRGADDVIDGDKSVEVHITVRTNPADPATEIGRTDMMEHAATTGTFGPGTAGMTLQKAVTSGLVDPGNLVAVREIVSPAVTTGTDTAVFSGPRSNYTIDVTPDHLLVTQTGANVVGQKVSDGIDTVRNIERLRFTDQTVTVAVPNAPTNVVATAGNRNARVTWTAPTGNGAAITSYDLVVKSGATVISTTTGIAPTTARTVTGLTPGTKYTFSVRAVNQFGAGQFGVSNEITAASTPAAPTALQAVRSNGSASLSWTPGADNSSAIIGYNLQIRNGATVVETRSITGNVSNVVISGLNNGTAYNFRLQAINGIGTSPLSAASNTVTPATLPGLVQIAAPTSGAAGWNVDGQCELGPATVQRRGDHHQLPGGRAEDGGRRHHGGLRPGERHRRTERPHQVVHVAGRQLPVRGLRHQRGRRGSGGSIGGGDPSPVTTTATHN